MNRNRFPAKRIYDVDEEVDAKEDNGNQGVRYHAVESPVKHSWQVNRPHMGEKEKKKKCGIAHKEGVFLELPVIIISRVDSRLRLALLLAVPVLVFNED